MAFVTAIAAPTVILSSERIVQRHVNSLLLAIFLRTQAETEQDNTKLTLQWFFKGNPSPCNEFVSWLSTTPPELVDPIAQLVRGTAVEVRSAATICAATAEAIRELGHRWNAEYDKLNSLAASVPDEAYRRALELERRRHEEEYLLKELASKAFLPGYGFPTDVVTLRNYNIEDFKHAKRVAAIQSREDNIFTNKDRPSRGLHIAIREYAPGSQVVVDGRVYRSAGVSLNWHLQGQLNEAQKFDVAWRCANCGASGVAENAYANREGLRCALCLQEVKESEKKMVLRPAGFVTDFYESTSNDVSSQKFIKVEPARIQLVGELLSLPDRRCGYLRAGHDGSVFFHSSGEHETGFAVCLACGRAESMTVSGEVPSALSVDKPHRPVGGAVGSRKEKDCSGAAVKSNVYLGYQIRTDVLEVFFRNPKTGAWLSDSKQDQVIASTLAVAIRDAIADSLGIASDEMGFGIRLDKDLESGIGRSVLQVFDQMSGGAGFVLAGLAAVVSLIRRAATKLDCPADCENVCSSCLAGNDARVEFSELDRKRAKKWLEDAMYLEHMSLPAGLSRIPGATYCSVGPLRAIRSAIDAARSGDTKRVLRVAILGDPKSWDLENARFRDSILTWQIVEKIQVQLAVPPLNELDDEAKAVLRNFEKGGVQLVLLDPSWQVEGAALVAQFEAPNQTFSLLATPEVTSLSGASWIDSSNSATWVTSWRFPRVPVTTLAIPTEKSAPAGAIVLEIGGELDGHVTGLKARFSKLLDERAPNLAALVRDDSAVSITYSDRYLKSPWTVMLLGSFLHLFNSDRLKSILLRASAPTALQPGFQLTHDWSEARDIAAIIPKWLERTLRVPTQIDIVPSRDLQHGRVLTIEWASGLKTRVIFDQGMGYWRLQDSARFDFNLNIDAQLSRMAERLIAAKMIRAGVWPTYITVTTQ